MTSEVIPNAMTTGCADAEPLIILLSFLADHGVSVDLLCRGTSPRKRWTDGGEISKVDPATLGLSDDLIRSCIPEILTRTLSRLDSAIVWESTARFRLVQGERERTFKRLPSYLYPFWSLQALTLACRSVPWKFLEYKQPDAVYFAADD